MNKHIAMQSLSQAALSLCITHSTDPEKEKRLRRLDDKMQEIMDEYEELTA